jgi:hypothetical protein
VKLTSCQASGQNAGYFYSLNSGLVATMTDCNAWGNTQHGILAGAGHAGSLIIRGGLIRSNPNHLSVASSTGIVDIDECAIDGTTGIVYNVSVSTSLLKIGSNINYLTTGAGIQLAGTPSNIILPTVASASIMNLPANGNDFNVSGATDIFTAVFGWAGRQVTFYFSGVLTVHNQTASYNQIRLANGANFTTAAGSSLTIRHNGVQWYETGRSA